jgi:hypothetical protein
MSDTRGTLVRAINQLIDERNEAQEALEQAILAGSCCGADDQCSDCPEERFEKDPHGVNDAIDRAVVIALDSLAHDARNGSLLIQDQQVAAWSILLYDVLDTSVSGK